MAPTIEPGVNIDLESSTACVGGISSLSALAAFIFNHSTEHLPSPGLRSLPSWPIVEQSSLAAVLLTNQAVMYWACKSRFGVPRSTLWRPRSVLASFCEFPSQARPICVRFWPVLMTGRANAAGPPQPNSVRLKS